MGPSSAQATTPWVSPSALALFTVYATAAAAQSAGVTSDPYDPTKPLKGWVMPAGSQQPDADGDVTFTVFDPNAAVNAAAVKSAIAATQGAYGQLTTIKMPLAQALALNLPGAFYPPMPSPLPCSVDEYGPYGEIPQSPFEVSASVCLQADAQAMVNQIWAQCFPSQTPPPVTQAFVQGTSTVWWEFYAGELRRAWVFYIPGVSGGNPINCQAMITLANKWGVGAPVQWSLVSGALQCKFAQPPAVAPAGETTVLTPVRPLLPNEVLVYLPPALTMNPLFDQAGVWQVQRIDIAQPTVPPSTAQSNAAILKQITALEQQIAALQQQLAVAG
ncbi:MAG: hypothetical protein KGL39_11475 [Patescibacteria group bacterium]|nr:hypothetical protein [Patescibacteria group bacterium]